jgi:hypothetical protein
MFLVILTKTAIISLNSNGRPVLVMVMQRSFFEVKNSFNHNVNKFRGSRIHFTGFSFDRQGVLYSFMGRNCFHPQR